MVWHDRESMHFKLSLFAIAKERFEKEFSMHFSLEVAVLKKGCDGNGVGFALY